MAESRTHEDLLKEAPPPPPRMLAMVVAGAMFMAQLDSTIIATALPKMAETFGGPAVNLSLGISIYLMVQVVLLPASSWVSDRLGARRVFAFAVLAFTIASLLCGASRTLGAFVIARILQGAAAALMAPVARVVLIRSTPKEHLVGVLTITSTPMLLAPTLGPPVGGFIVTYLDWPWVFYLNLPVGLLLFALIWRIVPDLRSDLRKPFDFAGFVLAGIALCGLIYGFDRITAPGIARTGPAFCLLAGFAFLALTVRHSLRTPHPLLSLAPLRFPTFRIPALGGGFFARIPMRALPFLLPLMFQLGMGMTAFASGMLVMAMSGADLVIKPLVRGTLQRFGFRTALLGSLAISTITGSVLAFVGSGTPLALIFAIVATLGFARSILFSGMSTLLFVDIEDQETGAANVLWSVVQQVTNALAISFTVIGLNLIAWTHGSYGAKPDLADFRATLLLLAAFGIPAMLSFAALPAHAGARMSGHRPKTK